MSDFLNQGGVRGRISLLPILIAMQSFVSVCHITWAWVGDPTNFGEALGPISLDGGVADLWKHAPSPIMLSYRIWSF